MGVLFVDLIGVRRVRRAGQNPTFERNLATGANSLKKSIDAWCA
jgi:hypothetical protein